MALPTRPSTIYSTDYGDTQGYHYQLPCRTYTGSYDRPSIPSGNTDRVEMSQNRVDSIPDTLQTAWRSSVTTAPNMEEQRPTLLQDRQDEFHRRYQQLSQNIAYRFPDPGPPRERQGRVGGNWRHIKEVLGHGGSRVVFVDGLVRLYDWEKSAAHSAPLRSSLRTPHHDVSSYGRMLAMEREKRLHKYWKDPLPPLSAARPQPQPVTKHKGFYTLRRENTVA